MTPSECRSAYASFYRKNEKYIGIAPHRRRSYQDRLHIARRNDRKIVRKVCREVEDLLANGTSKNMSCLIFDVKGYHVFCDWHDETNKCHCASPYHCKYCGRGMMEFLRAKWVHENEKEITNPFLRG